MRMNDSSDAAASPLPRRIQRQRTRGWKMPPNTVYVGRPTKWGNPRTARMLKGYTVEDAVKDYRRWLARDIGTESWCAVYGLPPTVSEIKRALTGKNLCCWCAPSSPCHAAVLLEIANASPAYNWRE